MIKKILKIVAKIIAGIILLYFFIAFIILPFAAKWAIQDQGTKLLGHPVRVRSVIFNPLLLRVGIYDFEIQDGQKNVMARFQRLRFDASFLKFLKKTYQVEFIELVGLKVNVNLMPDGTIGLMGLIPTGTAQPAQPVKPEETVNGVAQPKPGEASGVEPTAPPPLPLVVVDKILVRDSQVRFTDQTIQPQFSTTLGKIDIDVTGLSTDPQSLARVVVKAVLGEKGAIASETQVKPFVQPLQLETTFTFDNYALDVLTPYVGKYTGRALKDGKLDFRMDYRIEDNTLTASHKVLIQRFEFGSKVKSKDALNLPFGLVVALLEDPQGRISISLPVKGDMSDPEFEYWHLVGQVVRNFFMKIVTSPFSALASAMGGGEEGTDELGYVKFTPGRAELSDAEKGKIKTLAKGLKERPKVILEVNGSYDPDMDWKAIKTEVFDNDYKVLKQDSTRSEAWLYQQLYQRKFGIKDLWALVKKFKSRDGVIDEAGLSAEIKSQLIEKGSPDKVALEALATGRAQVVYDALLAEGLDNQHVKLGGSRSAQGSMGSVPLEFTLTVFGDTSGDAETGAQDGSAGTQPEAAAP